MRPKRQKFIRMSLRGILGGINVIIFLGLVYLYACHGINLPTNGWNWTDLITILLTIVTIVLGALGTLIAVAALLGYQHIHKSAELRSGEAVDEYLNSEVFEKKLSEMIDRQYERSRAIRGMELSPGQEPIQSGCVGNEVDWKE